jgi:hypothetical protein
MILRVPGKALRLRVARIEKHDFRRDRLRLGRACKHFSIATFSPSGCQSLSKSAQFELEQFRGTLNAETLNALLHD